MRIMVGSHEDIAKRLHERLEARDGMKKSSKKHAEHHEGKVDSLKQPAPHEGLEGTNLPPIVNDVEEHHVHDMGDGRIAHMVGHPDEIKPLADALMKMKAKC